MLRWLPTAVAGSLLAVLACSRDALPPGVDAGGDLAPRPVGAPCAVDGDCADGECANQPPFTGGYCTSRIAECPAAPGQGPCPAGASCIAPGIRATGGLDYCARRCVHDGDCRGAEGYRCCPSVAGFGESVCYPSAACR